MLSQELPMDCSDSRCRSSALRVASQESYLSLEGTPFEQHLFVTSVKPTSSLMPLIVAAKLFMAVRRNQPFQKVFSTISLLDKTSWLKDLIEGRENPFGVTLSYVSIEDPPPNWCGLTKKSASTEGPERILSTNTPEDMSKDPVPVLIPCGITLEDMFLADTIKVLLLLTPEDMSSEEPVPALGGNTWEDMSGEEPVPALSSIKPEDLWIKGTL
ncbi:hypothetical protein BTVI_58530 [Pitangus sulphuratus]|nr:hypothetical protein BTVI_58530 [Pitangus sulphuratus]